MNTSIKLGEYNTLVVKRIAENGAYLSATDGGLEVLMPKRYVLPSMHAGDELRLFVYLDQDNRPVATTETPLIKAGAFAYLEAAWTNKYGAFLNCGLMKDLFVPFSEQSVPMEVGGRYVVYCFVDELSGRLVGTSKIGRRLQTDTTGLRVRDKVEVLIFKHTPIGYRAIILEHGCEGLLYASEVFRNISYGDRLTAYVKKVRTDGKVDLVLQASGQQHNEQFASILLRALQEKPNHFIGLSDNSDPEEIYNYFGVSKKTFKRAVGMLYKERIIDITPDGVKLSIYKS